MEKNNFQFDQNKKERDSVLEIIRGSKPFCPCFRSSCDGVVSLLQRVFLEKFCFLCQWMFMSIRFAVPML